MTPEADTLTQPAAAAPDTVSAPTLAVETAAGRIAWRRLGPEAGVPLVFLNRFRGTMDDWDPALLDRIARERGVIIFDAPGVARSGGTPATTLVGWAANAASFIRALGLDRVDLLGFSFGGLVAQELTLAEPALVRRLVIAGSGAGHVEGAGVNPAAIAVATKPVNTDADFLYLFFRDTPSSQAAGEAYRARLRQRADAFVALADQAAWLGMLSAASDVGTPETSLLTRVGAIRQPVLVANGVEDIMIPTFQSFALTQAIPDARLVIYPDSGHGFLFQHAAAFGDEVCRFLAEPDAD